MALLKHRGRTGSGTFDEGWPLLAFPSWPRFGELWEGFGLGEAQVIRVEEFAEGDTLVVRAELPGIDPERDAEITVEGDVLHITAHRHEEEETTERDFRRRELRYGSFARSIRLPEGVDETSVAASYKDGILEVRVPMPQARVKPDTQRVPVTRS